MTTRGAFFYTDQHLTIDNTALESDVVARTIAERFTLPLLSEG